MTPPTLDELDHVSEATWPAASQHRMGPFMLRQGQGGGQRVSAATAEGDVTAADIAAADRAMSEMGQRPIFRVRPGEGAFDAALARAGYVVHDPVNILVAPTQTVAVLDLPTLRSFDIWPPLAIMDELWVEGGIGPRRRAVMDRVKGPKLAVLGRGDDRPAGVAFAAIHQNVAMMHAVHVSDAVRRRKVAHYMMVALARWAQHIGVPWLATLCVRDNIAANSMYAALGFSALGQYHYRVSETQSGQ
jgi:GNAT superfamily N-acetyltransferase